MRCHTHADKTELSDFLFFVLGKKEFWCSSGLNMNFDGPFRAVKEPMQPTFAPDSFLPNNKMSCEFLTNVRPGVDPQITTVDNSWRETARSDYLYHNK